MPIMKQSSAKPSPEDEPVLSTFTFPLEHVDTLELHKIECPRSKRGKVKAVMRRLSKTFKDTVIPSRRHSRQSSRTNSAATSSKEPRERYRTQSAATSIGGVALRTRAEPVADISEDRYGLNRPLSRAGVCDDNGNLNSETDGNQLGRYLEMAHFF